jgi:hypothetical protein
LVVHLPYRQAEDDFKEAEREADPEKLQKQLA